MIDLVSGLNPAQREAVLYPGGPLLVLAGAGSGKTRVLTHRIANLVANEGVDPRGILAITFTNKAAGEMRERLSVLMGPRARALWASTFHSACVRILRREAERVGYPTKFSIFDQDDQLRLLRAVYVDENLDQKRFPPRAAHAAISDAKNGLITPEAFAERAASFEDQLTARIYRRYADRLRASGAMDFDDLLMLTVMLLEGDAEVRDSYQRRFVHVLVDEYQDTNHAQYRFVRVLGEPQRNVTVVGDDDQGIYSWRGAEVRNILDFQHDYPEAHSVALEQNYRSTGAILRAANAVVSHNRDRLPKRLWTVRGEGEPIGVVACRDEHEEARLVIAQIDRALDAGESLDELAVFYRTNAQSRVIEDQLVRRAIPYQVIGGPRFYERAEIRDLLAWLRSAANPADEVSFARLLGVPRRGLGATTLGRLTGFAADAGMTVVDVAADAGRVAGIKPAQRGELATTARVLGEIAAVAEKMPLADVIDLALERSGLRDSLQAEGTFEAQGRLENLAELVRVAGEFEASRDEASLPSFLEEVALQADADQVVDGRGQVTLMTIHNAKGLEFETVLMTGMEEGLFPHQRSDTPEALQEERRLCYVGITRARRRLVLTYAESRALHGGRDYRLPSRFLGELPPDAIERVGQRRGLGFSAAGLVTRPGDPDYATGDEVVHDTFGEGIVIAIEQGGELVRVRFSQDGAERRLMAGAAPMRKARG